MKKDKYDKFCWWLWDEKMLGGWWWREMQRPLSASNLTSNFCPEKSFRKVLPGEKFLKTFPNSKVFACRRPFESVAIILGNQNIWRYIMQLQTIFLNFKVEIQE